MKPLIAILLLLCIANVLPAQTVDFYGKQVANDICTQFGMRDDKEAKDCMDKICDAADIPNNFVLAPCTNIDNCFALAKNDILYIVYDINFFNKVKTFGFTSKNLPGKTVDWAALTILAHELGHHVCQHTTNKLVREQFTPVQMELQADEFAGKVMYKLGATVAQAQLAMDPNMVPDEATLTHPARKDRLDAIAKGWNIAYKKNADRNSTNIAPNSGGAGNTNDHAVEVSDNNANRGNQPIVQRLRPAIIVIPYTKQGEDIRTILESDPAIAIAVTKIKEGFENRNFNTIDFVGKLKQIESQKTFHGQNQSDIKQQLIQNSGAQIYVEVQLNKITSASGLNKATVILQAYDVSSGLSLANGDCTSNSNRSTDFQALAGNAIALEHGDSAIPCGEAFLNTLQASMERMSKEGMPLPLQIGFSQQSKYNAHSIIKEDELGDILNDWLQKNTLGVNQGGVTKTMINYNEIRIPYTDPLTGKPALVTSFANKIVAFLRKTYAISAESDVNQGIIYITIN